jgi:phage baseplate assembly protein gpV
MDWRSPAAALVVAAVLAAPPLAGAQTEPPSPPVGHRHKAATATGTMTAYDPETRQLTVASATGSTAFRLASDARVWLGTRRLPVAQLKAKIGAQVTVSWSESDGVRTSHTLRLAADGPGGTP